MTKTDIDAKIARANARLRRLFEQRNKIIKEMRRTCTHAIVEHESWHGCEWDQQTNFKWLCTECELAIYVTEYGYGNGRPDTPKEFVNSKIKYVPQKER